MAYRDFLGFARHSVRLSLRASLKQSVVVCAAALTAQAGHAASDINAGSTYLSSNLGGSVNAVFNGGTLQLDQDNKTISRAFTVKDVATNTIDINGKTVTMSGAFSGAGPLTIANTAGGGALTLTGDSYVSSDSTSNYSGIITINNAATLKLANTLDSSDNITKNPDFSGASFVANGTLDISNSSGASVTTLSGSGSVVLGSNILTISDSNSATFSGVISGSGALYLTAGNLTLTNVNTFTGVTYVASGTLAITQNNGLAASSSVVSNGVFDISATTGTTLQSLSGAGTLTLGAQNLTLTNANGSFSGVVAGSGNIYLNSGTEYFSGANTFTGTMTVNSGATLGLGSATITTNVANAGSLIYSTSNTVAMSGIVSGAGSVTVQGGGTVTVSTVQTYSGATAITSGRLTLTGDGSISSSSGLTAAGTFDITGTNSGATITTLGGTGYVYLGTQTLTLANASSTFSGTLSGSGGLTITSGNETLSGTSIHTGATTISAGTLTLLPGASLSSSTVLNYATLDLSQSSATNLATSATIGSLAGNGTVILGSHTLVLAGAADTFTGTISGTGGLTVNSGVETLTAASTYSGATTINGGSLVLSGSGSLSSSSKVAAYGTFDISAASGGDIGFASLSGSGTVTLGAHNLVLNAASDTFSGVIQGSGGLIVTGGKEALSGTNTYSGGTTITGGTLQVGYNAATGSILGNVLDNGTLAFARTDFFTFSGTISGTGSVNQVSAGTTVLTADNTYSGGTTISSGTIQIGGRNTSGSIIGDVADSGTLAFARTDTITFGGVISGRGAVNLLTGTTILSGINTYTGGTAVKSGATLILGGGGSIARSSIVTDDGSLDMSGADASIVSLSGSGTVSLGSHVLSITNGTTSFAGAIAGTGGLTVTGGTQTLAGTNTYTGATTVNGGRLAVTGSIASSSGITVNSGGTLSGNGTVSALVVNNGGTVAPGNGSIGALTVNGSVNFASGSQLSVSTSSAAISKLSASGTASLAGALTVSSADGTYLLGQNVAVLTASGGVSGTFALNPITSNGAKFKSALTYDAHNVYLQIDLAQLSPLLPATATKNATNVVSAIDAAITAGKTLPTQIERLGNDTSGQLASDAAQLAGEIGATAPQSGAMLMSPFLDTMFEQMHGGRAPVGRGAAANPVWLTAFGGTNRIVGDPNGAGSHTFRSNVSGLAGGASVLLSQDFMIGAALSVGSEDFHLMDVTGKGTTKALQVGIYGYVRYSPHFYGSFAAAGALDQITTHRTLTVSGTDDLTGKATAYTFGGRYETGVTLAWFSPYVALQDQLAMVPAYSEKAASGSSDFALRYDARTFNTGSAEIGLRQSVDTDFMPRWILTPNGTIHLTDRLAWSHQLFSNSGANAAFVALPSSGFNVYRATAAKDSALVSLGAELEFDSGLSIGTHLDSVIAANAQSYTATAGLGYKW